ncbi:MAG: PHP domain-containing protein [Acidobacteria bacterium]|nr:PHP domain-containing protein [Acidobacteriota bacterium]
MRADLHVHTLISDGLLTPLEVMGKAESAGIDVLAITDHDSLAAHTQGLPTGRTRLIVGVEFTTCHLGREHHLLGYFRGLPPASFRRAVARVREERRERMREACRRLTTAGIALDFDQFLATQRSASLTSAHLARYLADQNAVSSEEEAFDLYLRGGRSVVPLPSTPMPSATEMINCAGGISVWAHPPLREFDSLIDSVVSMGIQGLEAVNYWRPDADPLPFVNAAARYSLITTGGTDFHSNTHPCPLGSRYVDESLIGAFLSRL